MRPRDGFRESVDDVRRALLRRGARIYECVDGDATRALVESHLADRENRRLLIWSLLCLEQWCQTFP